MKQQMAQVVASRVQSGEVIGIGTGSTVDCVIDAIGERIRKEKIQVACLATSLATAARCFRVGITVLDAAYEGRLSWGFDGADEVDPRGRLIKGAGGAMLREKILAARCNRFLIVVDHSKIVQHLGEKFPIPIEVIPEALSVTVPALERYGLVRAAVRSGTGKHGAVVTEKGNVIIDATFKSIPEGFEGTLKQIVGVVETGLFERFANEVVIATPTAVETKLFPR